MDYLGHEHPYTPPNFDTSFREIIALLKSSLLSEKFLVYQNIIFGFISGKISLRQAQIGLERLEINSKFHNRFISLILAKNFDYEVKNLQEILKSLDVVSSSEPNAIDTFE